MIKIIVGSIFDSDCDAFVNPVNCVGVMGAGLAKQFKDRYPESFRFYKELCDKNILEYGKVYSISSYCEHPKRIYLATTKYHWREKSSMFAVRSILKNLLKLEEEDDSISSVALPMIGAGLGKLDYNTVKHTILDTLRPSKLRYELYER